MNELTTINATGEIVKADAITDDLFTRFIAYLDLSEKSVKTYTTAIRYFMQYLADNGITAPTRQDILAYREHLEADHKPTTINLYIIATRLFFQWTAQEGLYPNIAEHIKGKRINREPKKDALTVAQIKDILANIDETSVQGLRDKAIIITAITCGLRTIELARLKIDDIRQSGDNLIIEVLGKGRDEKEAVKLPLTTYKAILTYLEARGEKDGNAPLFASLSNKNFGQEMTTRSISRIIKNAFINSGYNTDHLTAHSCRHTAVTIALLNNESIDKVQQMARHKNIATTLIYAHNIEASRNSCTDTIANAIFN